MKKRALLSVSDKAGIVDFAKGLAGLGYEIISTGGTEAELKKAGLEVINISKITNFPECLDGRVKTLHPAVHAGLLAMRDNSAHMERLKELKIDTIDVVAVNLYPFAQTIARQDVTRGLAIENIDIGGPAMLRSAAKNYKDVVVAVDPADYPAIINRLKENTADINFRLNLMHKVFCHTAYYDTMISDYLMNEAGLTMPDTFTMGFKKAYALRYGENPHQKAAFYRTAMPKKGALSGAKQLQGKELSYNNINDAACAVDLIKEFDTPAAVAVKHANPCGVALADNISEAYKKAHDCDPVSIYGGIVAVNRLLDKAAAQEMVKIFLEIIIAPSVTAEALEVFTAKPNLRVLELDDLDKPQKSGFMFKYVDGGMLYQSTDSVLCGEINTATEKTPTKAQLDEMMFAYKIVKHVKSNAIVLSRDFATVGIGSGQTNRIWAAAQACEHAGEKAKDAVAASDAYFPFPDCVTALAQAGITAIIQPGGSIRDKDSIDECNKRGIAMTFAGNRHFKH